MSLQLPDSGADISLDGRRHAPSAARNAGPILEVLRAEVPLQGRVLELASGSGQHAAEFAAALPGLDWQPSDLNPENLTSIEAWRAHAGCPNLRPAIVLDAGAPGWGAACGGQHVVLVVNLLHLIPEPAAEAVLQGMAQALLPGGKALIYGPFLRDGRTTSEGDAVFHASLRAQDARLGYKDLDWAVARLAAAGLAVRVLAMPANNLMIIGQRL